MRPLFIFLTVAVFFISNQALAQDFWEDWDSETIDETYVKKDVPSGTLDEDGDDIDYIFLENELEAGTYEVEIEDETGDLYHIKGTDYYLTFTGLFGLAGLGVEGILEINNYGGGYFYRNPNN